MEGQAYFGKEESFSMILPSRIAAHCHTTMLIGSSRKSKNEISLKNIGLIFHFADL
jgi:hypothetical protein